MQVNVNPDLLGQYDSALKTIENLQQEQVGIRLPSSQAAVANARAQLQSAQKTLANLQSKMAKEAKDVEKVRHLGD
jgi:hypothetical protein